MPQMWQKRDWSKPGWYIHSLRQAAEFNYGTLREGECFGGHRMLGISDTRKDDLCEDRQIDFSSG